MIKSIYVPKPKESDDGCESPMSMGAYVNNEVSLSGENSKVMNDLQMGDMIEVSMKVMGIREEQSADGKKTRQVTLEIPKDGDESDEYDQKHFDIKRTMN